MKNMRKYEDAGVKWEQWDYLIAKNLSGNWEWAGKGEAGVN